MRIFRTLGNMEMESRAAWFCKPDYPALFPAGLKFFRQLLDDFVGRLAALASGMAKSAGTGAVLYVQNHIVVLARRHAYGT